MFKRCGLVHVQAKSRIKRTPYSSEPLYVHGWGRTSCGAGTATTRPRTRGANEGVAMGQPGAEQRATWADMHSGMHHTVCASPTATPRPLHCVCQPQPRNPPIINPLSFSSHSAAQTQEADWNLQTWSSFLPPGLCRHLCAGYAVT